MPIWIKDFGTSYQSQSECTARWREAMLEMQTMAMYAPYQTKQLQADQPSELTGSLLTTGENLKALRWTYQEFAVYDRWVEQEPIGYMSKPYYK